MIEYNGKSYELKYNLKRVTIIENAVKKPVMQMVQSGFMTISELSACLAYGMIEEGADAYVNPKKASEMINELMNEDGAYMKLSNELAEALERDCPFFFRAG